jgi:hypothetical protein
MGRPVNANVAHAALSLALPFAYIDHSQREQAMDYGHKGISGMINRAFGPSLQHKRSTSREQITTATGERVTERRAGQ